MSYTLSNNIIIRRENFGALIFNPNTELTIKIDVTGFKFLKNLINYNKFSLQERSEYEMNEFFLEMIRFGVIIKKRKEPNTFFQFIERTNYDINVLSFPESLHLTITQNCNLRCRSCYYSDVIEGKLMSLKLYKVIIEEAKKEGLFQLAIGGGEPFCHPQIWKFLKIASKKQITTNITTNGTMISKNHLKKLEELENIGRIQISLDGSDELMHSLSRSHYEKVISCLNNLSSSNLSFGINMLMRNSNIDDLPNMVQLCQDLGAQTLHLLRIKPPIVDKNWFLTEKLDERSIRKLHNYLNIFKKQKKVEIFIDASLSYLFQNGDSDHLSFTGCNGCSGGITFLTILPDGTILPCTHLRMNLGNVKQGIKNIWINSKLLSRLRKKSKWIMEPCNSCSILKNCYGCRALSIEEKNNIKASDRECMLLRNIL